MRLCGRIDKLTVLILVDSSSVGTFISDRLASQLQMAIVATEPLQLVAADGSPMVCDKKILNLQWTIQNQTFFSSPGILPLKYFDMILGADWLEEHSPLWVHRARKVMRFTMNGRMVTLQGLDSDTVKCSAVLEQNLKGLLNRQAVTHCLQWKYDDVQLPVSDDEVIVAAVSDQEVHHEVQ